MKDLMRNHRTRGTMHACVWLYCVMCSQLKSSEQWTERRLSYIRRSFCIRRPLSISKRLGATSWSSAYYHRHRHGQKYVPPTTGASIPMGQRGHVPPPQYLWRGDITSPRPPTEAPPWTPLGDFRPPDIQSSFLSPPNTPARSTPLSSESRISAIFGISSQRFCFPGRGIRLSEPDFRSASKPVSDSVKTCIRLRIRNQFR